MDVGDRAVMQSRTAQWLMRLVDGLTHVDSRIVGWARARHEKQTATT